MLTLAIGMWGAIVGLSLHSFIFGLMLVGMASVSKYRTTLFKYLFWSVMLTDVDGHGTMRNKFGTDRFTPIATYAFAKADPDNNRDKALNVYHFYIDSILMAYYSMYGNDPALARKYHDKSAKKIDSDRDANGRRKLAYYHYAQGNKEAAKKTAFEGLDALNTKNDLITAEMLEYEEQLLRKLIEEIG